MTPLICRYRALALVIAVVALSACGKKPAPQKPPPPQVGVMTVQPQSVPLVRDEVGRLSAHRSADVRARVSGVVLQRTYDEGSDVKKGQVLFKIDPAPLQATLNSSLAALAQAQAAYTNNHVAAERSRELAPKGYISKADLDNAEAAERSSRAAVAAARANVDSARINLGYATVRSPIDGRAGKQQVTEGALVGQGSPTLLTTVDQIDPMYVNFSIGATDLDRLRQAQTSGDATLSAQGKSEVHITLPGGAAYPQVGTVDFSGTAVNPSTGAVTLRASIPNPDHTLLPGMYADLKINMGNLNKVFVVPQAAVQRDARGAYLLVMGDGNKVVRKDVTTGAMQKSNWIITKGLESGDKVIVQGIPKAKEGAPARPVPFTPGEDKGEQGAQVPAGAADKSGATPAKPATNAKK